MKTFCLFLLTILFIAISFPIFSCSTFMLKNDSILLFAQNLDMPYSIPGYITKNNRGKFKTSVTWNQIVQNGTNYSPTVVWVSKYGSITFTPMGMEFPEGGINEAGLYVREMSLPGSIFPVSNEKPNMFMMQWIQYQLDNYKTVYEVVENIHSIILDGWSWHFFVADATGNSASIEFLKGEAVIYYGDKMPYKVMTNSTYERELNKIGNYQGFGGAIKVDLNDKTSDNRFVHAAYMLKEANKESLQNPIQYGFDILRYALGGSGSQWSIVIDIRNTTIYFKTSVSNTIKEFNYSDFKYDCDSPVLICDININRSGAVSDYFVNYSKEVSLQYIGNGVEKVFGASAQTILKNTHNYTASCYNTTSYNFIEEKKVDKISVFINSTNKTLQIKASNILFENDSFQIIDISGRILNKGRLESKIIDISKLKKGIYIINLKIGKQTIPKNFVIE